MTTSATCTKATNVLRSFERAELFCVENEAQLAGEQGSNGCAH